MKPKPPTDHAASAVIGIVTAAQSPEAEALRAIAALEWSSDRHDSVSDTLRKAQKIATDALC